MNKLFFLICFRLDNPFFSCYNVPMKANCVNILKLIFLFTFGLFTLWGCGKGSEPADVNLMEEVSELPDATITIPSNLVGKACSAGFRNFRHLPPSCGRGSQRRYLHFVPIVIQAPCPVIRLIFITYGSTCH